MKAMKAYTIQFVGLKVGKHHFDYQIDNTFFLDFEYDEFNDVDLKVELLFEKKTTLLELHLKFMALLMLIAMLQMSLLIKTLKISLIWLLSLVMTIIMKMKTY